MAHERDRCAAERGRGAASISIRNAHFLWQQLPYVVALVLAIADVAGTSVSVATDKQMEA
jgi:hypothetical protein